VDPAAGSLLDDVAVVVEGEDAEAVVEGVELDDVAVDGVALDAVEALEDVALEAAALDDDASPPDATRSNSARFFRSSTSLPRIAGSIFGVAVPDVPTAPAVPEPLDGSVAGVSGPSSAVRFAATFAYEARQSVCVVISSLKFEISCDTWVRASPLNCAAAGSCVISLSVLRASVRCLRATCSSGCVCEVSVAGDWAVDPAGGCVGVVDWLDAVAAEVDGCVDVAVGSVGVADVDVAVLVVSAAEGAGCPDIAAA